MATPARRGDWLRTFRDRSRRGRLPCKPIRSTAVSSCARSVPARVRSPIAVQNNKSGVTRENPLPANKVTNPAQDAGSRPQITRLRSPL